ncbi:ABC transporter ATP-binding protein, partial [Rhizobium ruizarguesonis]
LEVAPAADLKDVALHEPDIEEVIRTLYQRRNADQRSNAKARAS